jgi:hypothetical protein
VLLHYSTLTILTHQEMKETAVKDEVAAAAIKKGGDWTTE